MTSKAKNKWFVATLIVGCRIENVIEENYMYDEQVVLLKAPDENAAYEKALKIGKEQEVNYKNSDGENVIWEFLGLEDLEELDGNRIQDGIEIKSRLKESDDPSQKAKSRERLSVFLTSGYQNSAEQRTTEKELAEVS
jgi:Domain of unknown function (DUF4288)